MAKKYSLNVEDGEVVSVEVDGVTYAKAEDIPDEDDRAQIENMVFDATEFPPLPAPTGKPFPVDKVVLSVFAAVGIVALAVAIFAGVRTYHALARERSAPGRVTAVETRWQEVGTDLSGSGGLTREKQRYAYPTVEFSLPDGTRQTVEIGEGTWPPAYEKGQEVTVLYDPDRPQDARIRSIMSTVGKWTFSLIFGVLGAAFLGASLAATWFMYLKPDPSKTAAV